ncbi:hypothetical protein K2Z84_03165 [Candidatus Binatia bacterium]|nr:hypothetical protein [Candidatus Binatia bacterium]
MRAAAWVLVMAVVAACSDSGEPEAGAALQVGVARRDITPTAATAPPDGSVYLGGYGFGPERPSSGVLAPIFVRAFVVSSAGGTIAFAENETQGAFAAYKQGSYGHADVARAVEEATGGAIPRTHVIVGSDHSHAGPDTTGVWGGLPDAYLEYLRDQTVGAILDAYAARRDAELWTGSTDATDLIRSQFDLPPNDVVDGELRVLAAVPPGGDPTAPFGLLVNYAAHATVMGGDNTLVSGDWPAVVADAVERRFGIDAAVVMVADVGRTQPRDGDVPADTDVERLEAYAARVTDRVLAAASGLTRHAGGEVASAQLFLREPYANPLFPLSFLGTQIARSDRAPWLEAETIGTVVSAARVGDLLFVAIPGEGYPAIQQTLERHVDAAEHFVFGLANDQLGYLIAPESGYPQVLAAAPDNDNAVFNVSSRIGDHVACVALAASRAVGLAVADEPPTCAPYAAEDHTLPF